MVFRATAISILLAFAWATSAYAQKTSPPPPPVESAAEAPSPEAIATARTFFDAMVIESGLAEGMLEAISNQMMPELRENLLNSPLYRQITPHHREALTAHMETMPALMRREFLAEMNVIGDRIAPRYAALVTVDEMQQLAVFMRSAEMRSLWGDMIAAYAATGQAPANGLPDWDDPSIPAFAAFAASPAGVAFAREQMNFNRIFDEEIQAATARMMPRIQHSVLSGICEVLENECPPHVRNMIQPT